MRSLATSLALVFLFGGEPRADSAGAATAAERLTYLNFRRFQAAQAARFR